jgi:uncharacterized SAM-binding protein YcdF (DUF218 family)
MNRTKKIILYSTSLAFIVTLITAFEIIYFGESAKPKKSDCIIVLGCQVYGTTPSPFLICRTNQALKLYKDGYGKYIIVSGGQGPGEMISEAEAMERYLVSKGVDRARILIEDKSGTTMANLINSKSIMDKKGFKTAVIVSNKYHLKRASLIAGQQGIDGSYSGVFVKNYKYYELVGYVREIPALMKYYLLKVYFKLV